MSQYAPKKPKLLNSFNVTLFLIASVLGYFGWWYLPHWFKVWRLSGEMIAVGRDAYREFDDEKLMQKLLTGTRRLNLPASADNFAIKRNPYSEEELAGYKDRFYPTKRGKSITIAFATIIPAEWPLFGGVTELEFHQQKTVDLTTVAY